MPVLLPAILAGGPPSLPPWRTWPSAHAERDGYQLHAAVHLHLEVQVRAGAEAGIAGQADLLAGSDPLADPYQRTIRLQVRVNGHAAVVVEDPHEVGAAAVALLLEPGLAEIGLDLHHRAGARGQHRGADVGGEVQRMPVLFVGVAEPAAEALVDAGMRLTQRQQVLDVLRSRAGVARHPAQAEFEVAGAAGILRAQARDQGAAAGRHGGTRGQRRIAAHVAAAGEAEQYLDRAGQGVVGMDQVFAVAWLHPQPCDRGWLHRHRDLAHLHRGGIGRRAVAVMHAAILVDPAVDLVARVRRRQRHRQAGHDPPVAARRHARPAPVATASAAGPGCTASARMRRRIGNS